MGHALAGGRLCQGGANTPVPTLPYTSSTTTVTPLLGRPLIDHTRRLSFWPGPVPAEPKIALLGAMQSLFEGSMYTFVFLWTPALSPNGEHIPHGMIFACFMVSCMVGSAIAGRLLANNSK